MVEDYLSDREQEEALRNWWRENWRWIIGGVVLGFALLGAYKYWETYRDRQAAESAGIDGLMVLPAMVYKSDPREAMTHFRRVARASALPIMCYNNPVSYGVDITPEMFSELADEPTLVAIKESSENVRRITDLKNV